MKKLDKKFLLISGSILSLLFSFLISKDSHLFSDGKSILDSNITAHADIPNNGDGGGAAAAGGGDGGSGGSCSGDGDGG